MSSTALKIIPRRSATRGHANHGWLKTYHTFSFASYHDPNFESFGSLRVINEDRVEPSEGFGKHSHREFEIFSYVVSGELEHRDSMGNLEILREGDVQMTSTGTGISHSEYNRNLSLPVHFLQIWALPNRSRLPPKYYNRHFPRSTKLDRLVKVVAPLDNDNDAGGGGGGEKVVDERLGKGPSPIHSGLTVFASILSPSSSKQELRHSLGKDTKRAYVHSIMKGGYRGPTVEAGDKFEDGGARMRLNKGLVLEEGDGAFVTVTRGAKEDERELVVENVGEREVEWLLFEMTD